MGHDARKPHHCAECGRVITPGTRYYREVWLVDGDFTTFTTHGNGCAYYCGDDDEDYLAVIAEQRLAEDSLA